MGVKSIEHYTDQLDQMFKYSAMLKRVRLNKAVWMNLNFCVDLCKGEWKICWWREPRCILQIQMLVIHSMTLRAPFREEMWMGLLELHDCHLLYSKVCASCAMISSSSLGEKPTPASELDHLPNASAESHTWSTTDFFRTVAAIKISTTISNVQFKSNEWTSTSVQVSTFGCTPRFHCRKGLCQYDAVDISWWARVDYKYDQTE